jgi:hypothetical protein
VAGVLRREIVECPNVGAALCDGREGAIEENILAEDNRRGMMAGCESSLGGRRRGCAEIEF